jgi:hypothetical protein
LTEATGQTQASSPKRNRRDHYLPQSYLRGFIDPARLNHHQPLWYFDVPNDSWSERSPREIGYRQGFYDYVTSEAGLETADDSFAELERTYPKVRSELTSNRFVNWKDHLSFLLRYVQMIRARSLLFFDQMQIEGQNLRAWVIEEVSPDRRSVKVRSMTPEPLPPAFIRNWTITQMRTQIQQGATWLNDFNWALRYCESSDEPFVICEMPLMAWSKRHSELAEMLRDAETLLFFPLCWQACLVGSRQFFREETEAFGQQDMQTTRRMYREKADLFIVSPRQVEFPKSVTTASST